MQVNEDEELVQEWLSDASDVGIEFQQTDSSSEDEQQEQQPEVAHKRKNHVMDNLDKLQQLVQRIEHSYKLPRGTLNKIVSDFNTTRWTVQRIWRSVEQQIHNNSNINVNNKLRGQTELQEKDSIGSSHQQNKCLLLRSLSVLLRRFWPRSN